MSQGFGVYAQLHSSSGSYSPHGRPRALEINETQIAARMSFVEGTFDYLDDLYEPGFSKQFEDLQLIWLFSGVAFYWRKSEEHRLACADNRGETP